MLRMVLTYFSTFGQHMVHGIRAVKSHQNKDERRNERKIEQHEGKKEWSENMKQTSFH